MKSQISRNSHDPSKRYSGVYQQQGRMITDADWNELQELVGERLTAALADVVGTGVLINSSSRVRVRPDDIFFIRGARVYAGGHMGSLGTEFDGEEIVYTDQPDFPDPPGDLVGGDLVYADVWEREVTFLEDGHLADSALGADTCTRSQTMVQLKRGPGAVHAGLRGEYFRGTAFEQRVRSRIDKTVDFDWSTASPAPNVPPDNFTVSWTGFIVPPSSDQYKFTVEADDGVRLWIGNQLVIDRWGQLMSTADFRMTSAPVALEERRAYPIRLHFLELGGNAVVRLLWSKASSPNAPPEVIPQDRLFPDAPAMVSLSKLPEIGEGNLTLALRRASTSTDACDPCAREVDVEKPSGNYVFRVEVHEILESARDRKHTLTLKWSSENAAEARSFAGSGPEADFDGPWIFEFFDADSEKRLGYHAVTEAQVRPPLKTTLTRPAAPPNAFVRRWDGYCKIEEGVGGVWSLVEGKDRGVTLSTQTEAEDAQGRVHIEEGSLTINLLEIVLTLQLGRNYLTGDYWLATIRDGEMLPRRTTPDGIRHRYAMVGAVYPAGPEHVNYVAEAPFPALAQLASRDFDGSGAAQVGGGQLMGSPVSIPAGTVRDQLSQLLGVINDLVVKVRTMEDALQVPAFDVASGEFTPKEIFYGSPDVELTIFGSRFDKVTSVTVGAQTFKEGQFRLNSKQSISVTIHPQTVVGPPLGDRAAFSTPIELKFGPPKSSISGVVPSRSSFTVKHDPPSITSVAPLTGHPAFSRWACRRTSPPNKPPICHFRVLNTPATNVVIRGTNLGNASNLNVWFGDTPGLETSIAVLNGETVVTTLVPDVEGPQQVAFAVENGWGRAGFDQAFGIQAVEPFDPHEHRDGDSCECVGGGEPP